MTYGNCKAVISGGKYVKAELLDKFDVFLLANRITKEQYEELVALVNATND